MEKTYYSKLTMKGIHAVKKSIETHGDNEGLFLVALSGGADSLALAIAAAGAMKQKNAKFTIGAVIVNHKIQAVTDQITLDAKAQAEILGLSPIIVKELSIKHNGGGMESDARDARYEAFKEALEESDAQGILVGHTMNDNAEQVLLGLIRGSGTRSISGIAENRDYIIRPFIKLTRKDTEDICLDNKLEYWVDPQNSSDDITRVRVRRNVIPKIREELGEAVISNLAKTAEIAREDADSFDFMMDHLYPDYVVEHMAYLTVEVAKLLKLPMGLQKRMVRKVIMDNFGAYGSSKDVERILVLVHEWKGQSFIEFTGGRVMRNEGKLVFTVAPK